MTQGWVHSQSTWKLNFLQETPQTCAGTWGYGPRMKNFRRAKKLKGQTPQRARNQHVKQPGSSNFLTSILGVQMVTFFRGCFLNTWPSIWVIKLGHGWKPWFSCPGYWRCSMEFQPMAGISGKVFLPGTYIPSHGLISSQLCQFTGV